MIQVENLTKDYGSRRAINNLSFQAEKGEILGFLGPNGAGKTTAMRILSGFMPPTSGTATIAGYDVVADSLEIRKKVGYMPEQIALYDDMTVFGYLKYMADLHKVENASQRSLDVIEQVGLTERAQSYISTLSKGMRQRVGLANALIPEPDLLILDEPTIGLDPNQIRDVRSIIQEIGKEHTVLLSTHILSEAEQICDRVLIINEGRIVAEDTPDNLRDRLTGVQRYSLKVAGDDDGLEKLVGSVDGVTKTALKKTGVLEFETRSGKDSRPDVARAVVNAKFDLLELRSIGMSLEDVFLQLTQEDPPPPDFDDTIQEIPLVQEEEE